MAAWLTPEISLMRPRAEDPVDLYLTVGPQKLWDSTFGLFEAAKYVVICYTAVEN